MIRYIISAATAVYLVYFMYLPWNHSSQFNQLFTETYNFFGISCLLFPLVFICKWHFISILLISNWIVHKLGLFAGMFGMINSTIFPNFLYYTVISIYSAIFAKKLFSKIKSTSNNTHNIPTINTNIKKAKKPKIISTDNFTLPKMSFLTPSKSHKFKNIPREKLSQTLQEFNVEGELINEHNGPVVTLFEFKPAPGVKASKIVNLASDIARSTESLSARIATIPGKNLLGIELPNKIRNTISLRSVIDSSVFKNNNSNLPLALGCDIAGNPVVVDLSTMPHLLVSGTTGSGKSVSMHSMILSLLYSKTPDDCKFILVDPKILELSIYDDIPHLLTPVVTDPKEAVKVLKWAVQEMDRRYKLIFDTKTKNISSFNEKIANPAFQKQSDKHYDKMPYLVIIVDEMADLMMTAGKEVEFLIQRLSQKARASGIHIIMATQRPSVDVITGTIKSNFPARITFQLASKIDSRTVMDNNVGAEQLLGKGDMLYSSPGYPITRIQAPFVSDDEVHTVINFLKEQKEPQYIELEVRDYSASQEESEDPLYLEALAIIKTTKKTSASYIQRELRIGYNRASKIIETMEKQGILSKPDRTGKREILIG